MKKVLLALPLCFGLTLAMPAPAAPANNAFANCMVDNLNGKERRELAKWIFLAMAAHPDLKPYSQITDKDADDSNKYAAELITRLMTVNCPNELRQAYAADPQAIKKSFELVGQVAMQELMTNQDVTNALTAYARYLDKDKIQAVVVQK